MNRDILKPKLPSKYSVGNRIYNGVSSAPQVGAGGPNPAGYQAREQQANVKRVQLQKIANGKGRLK